MRQGQERNLHRGSTERSGALESSSMTRNVQGGRRNQYADGVSILVPVYNSADSITELTERLTATLSALTTKYEILLIDDGSQDTSAEVILQLVGRDRHVKGVRLARNYGQHNALLSGIRRVSFPITVTIDDDLQNAPEDIPLLLEVLKDCDVVYGCPESEVHNWWRAMASRATKLALAESIGNGVIKDVSAFRAFRTHLRDGFATYNNPFVCIDVLLSWTTTNFRSVSVTHHSRAYGKSTYTARKLIAHAFNMITGFTTWPLQIASLFGFLLTGFGVLVLLYVGLRFAVGSHPVAGFTFLASIIAIFSGTQLFALGVFGEYLARMHFRIMDRPAYIVAGGELFEGQRTKR